MQPLSRRARAAWPRHGTFPRLLAQYGANPGVLDRGPRKALTQRRRFGSGLILRLKTDDPVAVSLFAADAAGAAESGSERRRMAMGARYAAAIAFILCATAFPAFAGPYYSMVGGVCTDGIRDDTGELLCNFHGANVQMADGYVPGTFFADNPWDPQSVDFLDFYDGVLPYGYVFTGFPIDCCGSNLGSMGGPPDGDFLQFHWLDGPNFEAFGGRWFYSTPTGGDQYFSSGTYDHWEGPRIFVDPEPQSLALASLALATLVLVRSRRSRIRMRA